MSTKNSIEIFLEVYRKVSGVYYAQDTRKSWGYRLFLSAAAIVPIITLFALLDSGEIYKTISTFIPAVLLNAAMSVLELEKIAKRIKRIITISDSYRDISIVGLMAKDKYKKTITDIQYLLFGSAVITGVLNAISDAFSYGGLMIAVAFGIIMILNYLVFIYRIKAGYYGNNTYEAKEIIAYIQKNSSSISDGPRSGGKKILEQKSLGASAVPDSPEGLQHV